MNIKKQKNGYKNIAELIKHICIKNKNRIAIKNKQ